MPASLPLLRFQNTLFLLCYVVTLILHPFQAVLKMNGHEGLFPYMMNFPWASPAFLILRVPKKPNPVHGP